MHATEQAAYAKSVDALNSWRNDAGPVQAKVKWSNPAPDEFRRDVVTLAEVEAAMGDGETLTPEQRKAVIDTILARYPGSIDRESLEGHSSRYLVARYKSIKKAEIAEGFIEEKTLKKEQAQAAARAEQEAENADSYKRGVARLNDWRDGDVAPADTDAYERSVQRLNAWRR